MSEISASTVGVFRNAPSGSSAIELYNYNGAEEMTVSQLVMAIAIRASAVYERDSVVQLNLMNRGVDRIKTLTDYGEKVLAGDNAAWPDIKKSLEQTYGLTKLPDSITSYTDQMSVMEQIRQKLTDENSSVDRIAIEIETAINRRDSEY